VSTLPKAFGHYVRILHWCTDQRITGALAEMELTASQGPILGYIAHRKTPPCARDIEEEFHLSHPTVSGLLSRLEKKGFLEFFPDENDRRCKRLRLRSKGQQCIEIMHKTIQENERVMVQGFSEEEQALFLSLLHRAIHNMGGDPCCRRPKEDTTT
jgi:DNA-binding MarR family transcriptional regulator